MSEKHKYSHYIVDDALSDRHRTAPSTELVITVISTYIAVPYNPRRQDDRYLSWVAGSNSVTRRNQALCWAQRKLCRRHTNPLRPAPTHVPCPSSPLHLLHLLVPPYHLTALLRTQIGTHGRNWSFVVPVRFDPAPPLWCLFCASPRHGFTVVSVRRRFIDSAVH
jgi:hypothetical protein